MALAQIGVAEAARRSGGTLGQRRLSHLAVFSTVNAALGPWSLGRKAVDDHLSAARHRRQRRQVYEIDSQLNMTVSRAWATHACRLVHRESNQLIIGPYFVDAQTGPHATCKLKGRMTTQPDTSPIRPTRSTSSTWPSTRSFVHSLAVTPCSRSPCPAGAAKAATRPRGVCHRQQRRRRRGT